MGRYIKGEWFSDGIYKVETYQEAVKQFMRTYPSAEVVAQSADPADIMEAPPFVADIFQTTCETQQFKIIYRASLKAWQVRKRHVNHYRGNNPTNNRHPISYPACIGKRPFTI